MELATGVKNNKGGCQRGKRLSENMTPTPDSTSAELATCRPSEMARNTDCRAGVYRLSRNETASIREAPVPRGLRWLFLTGGVGCVVLGMIGVFLPGLPTTPFLLLACWCFARSSPRMEAALLRSRLFGPIIHDWRRQGGIRRPIRNYALAMVTIMISVTCLFFGLSWVAKALVVFLGCFGMLVIMRLPLARDT